MKTIFAVVAALISTWASSQTLGIDTQFHKGYFPLVRNGAVVPLYTDPSDFKVVNIAATAFQNDLFEIGGRKPSLSASETINEEYAVIIGTVGHSKPIDELVRDGKLSVKAIRDQWEAFTIQVISSPLKNVKQALVIAGSDRRGTAFGVFEVSKQLGVSPWTWWADVHPQQRKNIFIRPTTIFQSSPSVKYRGIFINDEDWGLQPWAAKNMDTGIKDIGPKTYAKVFELLLRLKGNYIWPAMHPCTKAFYYYKDNPRVADDYAIVVGASHCEPMLRNNVFEWAENFEHEYGKKPGEWRYDLNGPEIYKYWEDRVKESRTFESVYTVGMRGIHDGSMPGPKDMAGKVSLLQKIINDQRSLLHDVTTKDANAVPQIFCPYKEVLNVYRNGVQLPDDVSIVWADDNHGYIRQLSNEEEQKKSGRSGIYYHLSYWGSPHDYLWLSSISPSLISYEMSKAYAYGADRLWVFNVGDIKPAEMELEFAMDLAWNVKAWPAHKAADYIEAWAERTFGKEYAKEIAGIKKDYYYLATSGKPEHMASIRFTPVEEQERLDGYRSVVEEAEKLKAKIPQRLQDAYFQLVLYPVKGAALMNQKIIFAQRSLGRSGVSSVLLENAKASEKAFQEIQSLTSVYNTSIAGGKWDGIMSWKPRDLAVFQMPKVATEKNVDSLRRAAVIELEHATFTFSSSDYEEKKEVGAHRLQSIKGLGISGNGLTLVSFQPIEFDSSFAGISYADYQFKLPAGHYRVTFKCLPTQSINSDGTLYFGWSFNGSKTEKANIHAESETAEWKQNVLRGYAEAKAVVQMAEGKNTLRIYFPEAGFVLSSIEMVRL